MSYCAECSNDHVQRNPREMAGHKLRDHPQLLSERSESWWREVLYMNCCRNDHVFSVDLRKCPNCGQPDVDG